MKKVIPIFFIEMLQKQYGDEITNKIMDGYLQEKPVTLRVNSIKSDMKNIKTKLENENIKFKEVSWNKDALILESAKEERIKELDMYQNGEIYLQSLSSMIPPIILNPTQKENILDMAAAPGGKTTQIAAMTDNNAMITACEKNKIRAERLKYNLEKQGAGSVSVILEDARKLSEFFSFDKILLDAPCSGSGTSNVYSEKFSKELIDRSAKTQEILLRKALQILKPGKEMVYSTCSILLQENENVLKKVLKDIDAEIVKIDKIVDIPLLPTSIEGTLCICPNRLYEGFFVAKIRKKQFDKKQRIMLP